MNEARKRRRTLAARAPGDALEPGSGLALARRVRTLVAAAPRLPSRAAAPAGGSRARLLAPQIPLETLLRPRAPVSQTLDEWVEQTVREGKGSYVGKRGGRRPPTSSSSSTGPASAGLDRGARRERTLAT